MGLASYMEYVCGGRRQEIDMFDVGRAGPVGLMPISQAEWLED